MKKGQLFLLCCITMLVLSLACCSKQPYACFDTEPEEDSLHVNQPVVFNAFCSPNAKEYFWEFNEDDDSVAFTAIVSKTFYDTGTIEVKLLVSNGKKTNRLVKSLRINP